MLAAALVRRELTGDMLASLRMLPVCCTIFCSVVSCRRGGREEGRKQGTGAVVSSASKHWRGQPSRTVSLALSRHQARRHTHTATHPFTHPHLFLLNLPHTQLRKLHQHVVLLRRKVVVGLGVNDTQLHWQTGGRQGGKRAW